MHMHALNGVTDGRPDEDHLGAPKGAKVACSSDSGDSSPFEKELIFRNQRVLRSGGTLIGRISRGDWGMGWRPSRRGGDEVLWGQGAVVGIYSDAYTHHPLHHRHGLLQKVAIMGLQKALKWVYLDPPECTLMRLYHIHKLGGKGTVYTHARGRGSLHPLVVLIPPLIRVDPLETQRATPGRG